ncbi:hypothetical protein [Paenibacillus terrigena]|uniref:hypothetical protein n=1 Tax=Paenibacillus terrigena TaxID=369333 RepID=UPI0012ECA61C|nr:hypothetical protein [Paenibacillus terrigena]
MVRKKKLPRIAIALLIVGLLSGFAYVGGKLLFQENQGPWQVEYRTSADNFQLQHITPEQIRSKMAEVKSTLVTGEAAVIYFADLEREVNFSMGPLLGVKQPEKLTDWNQWLKRLQEQHISVPIPEVLPGPFHFEAGQLGSPLGGDLDEEGLNMLDQLRQESQETGNSIVWRKVPDHKPLVDSYSFIYQNEGRERLFVRLIPSPPENILIKATLPESTTYEEVTVGSVKAHYISHEYSIYSESNHYKEMTWIQTNGDQSYLVGVSSDSPDVTKDQLIQAAESIQ